MGPRRGGQKGMDKDTARPFESRINRATLNCWYDVLIPVNPQSIYFDSQ